MLIQKKKKKKKKKIIYLNKLCKTKYIKNKKVEKDIHPLNFKTYETENINK